MFIWILLYEQLPKSDMPNGGKIPTIARWQSLEFSYLIHGLFEFRQGIASRKANHPRRNQRTKQQASIDGAHGLNPVRKPPKAAKNNAASQSKS